MRRWKHVVKQEHRETEPKGRWRSLKRLTQSWKRLRLPRMRWYPLKDDVRRFADAVVRDLADDRGNATPEPWCGLNESMRAWQPGDVHQAFIGEASTDEESCIARLPLDRGPETQGRDGILGFGRFGLVFEVCIQRRLYALKHGDWDDSCPRGPPESIEGPLREMLALRRVGKHMNIVDMLSANDAGPRMPILMEHWRCTLGDALFGYERSKGIDSGVEWINLVAQAGRGLCHIHHMGVVHLDVKPESIVLCHGAAGADGRQGRRYMMGGPLVAKIAGFSVGRELPLAPQCTLPLPETAASAGKDSVEITSTEPQGDLKIPKDNHLYIVERACGEETPERVGTVGYMPLELMSGGTRAHPAQDVFGLGTVGLLALMRKDVRRANVFAHQVFWTEEVMERLEDLALIEEGPYELYVSFLRVVHGGPETLSAKLTVAVLSSPKFHEQLLPPDFVVPGLNSRASHVQDFFGLVLSPNPALRPTLMELVAYFRYLGAILQRYRGEHGDAAADVSTVGADSGRITVQDENETVASWPALQEQRPFVMRRSPSFVLAPLPKDPRAWTTGR